VVIARSGAEALRKVLEDDFAVILLDLHMPGMDGYETAELIRSRKRTAGTPIVFLTAIFRDEAHVFQAYSAGAVDVVFKPVDPFILKSKVRVLRDLYLRTEEVKRQSALRQWLLDENARVRTEKSLAEQALRRTEARQQAILRSLPVVFHARSVEPPFAPTFVSDAIEAITGFTPDAFLADPAFGFGRIHPDDAPRVSEATTAAVGAGAYVCEYRWLCADGGYRTLMDQGVLAPSEDGERQELFGVILDVTERRSLEEQLTQARKMEAVGQLTGGVAHDFNNLLTVVLGNVDMLGRKAEDEAKRQRRVDAIRQAAERGRDLTLQLLAFSRRQHLQPVTLDVNALVRRFAPLLHQAIGDAVTLHMELIPEPLHAHVDATQLETALLNLAVNARDAMPQGGDLAVRTRVAAAPETPGKGQFICVELSDTGVGMTADVRERVFEPFFTTKEVGKGSGLGLSQVYGFVKQSDGHVRLDSTPGQGTQFHLYLPLSDRPAEQAAEAEAPREAPRGSESLLVVEDDPSVLALAVELLTGLGYRVLTATNAAEALEVLGSGEAVDLLFSDVVMPGGVSGAMLAGEAQAIRPELKVLLTSGYFGDREGGHDIGHPVLDKPYDRQMLAAKVRSILNSPGRRRRSEANKATAQAQATG
jgi:signal transduction histidine kinase